MHLACSFSESYLQHFLVMAKSLVINTDAQKITFHIVHRSLKDRDIKDIIKEFEEHRNLEFKFYEIDFNKIINFSLKIDYLAHETYCRLILAQILPTDIDKVIYIDADIIVKSDISELYNIEVKDYYIGATLDLYSHVTDHLDDIDSAEKYFNAGVMLINLEKWRKYNFSNICLDYASKNNKKMLYADQDVMNCLLDGEWLRVPQKWNVTRNIFSKKDVLLQFLEERELEEALLKPSIIHYTASSKPWHLMDNYPFKEEYHETLGLLKKKFSIFPEKKFLENKNIILFGTGETSKKDFEILSKRKISIKYFFDNKKDKWDTYFNNILVKKPDIELINRNTDLIVISSQFYQEIEEQLVLLGLKKDIDFFSDIASFSSFVRKWLNVNSFK